MRVRFSLRPPKIMTINQKNNLLELFYDQYRKEKPDQFFLRSLKAPYEKITWRDTYINILKLAEELNLFIENRDRCLLISENRPEWLIADLAIMNAGGISVPVFTTYSENDYKYIIEDCKPSVIIVSNQTQFDKIKKFINSEIKLIISFEKIDYQSLLIEDIFFQSNFEKKKNTNLDRNTIVRNQAPDEINEIFPEAIFNTT